MLWKGYMVTQHRAARRNNGMRRKRMAKRGMRWRSETMLRLRQTVWYIFMVSLAAGKRLKNNGLLCCGRGVAGGVAWNSGGRQASPV